MQWLDSEMADTFMSTISLTRSSYLPIARPSIRRNFQ
jgi:hypothetical protein